MNIYKYANIVLGIVLNPSHWAKTRRTALPLCRRPSDSTVAHLNLSIALFAPSNVPAPQHLHVHLRSRHENDVKLVMQMRMEVRRMATRHTLTKIVLPLPPAMSIDTPCLRSRIKTQHSGSDLLFLYSIRIPGLTMHFDRHRC